MDKDSNWLGLDVARGHTLLVPQPGQSPGDAACQPPPAQQPPSAGPHAGPLRGEGLCHLRGLPAFPPSPGLPRFPDSSPQAPGPWPPGQLALPASHGREAECWATVVFTGWTPTHLGRPVQRHELDHPSLSKLPPPGGTRLVCEGPPPGPHALPGAFTVRILTDEAQAAGGSPRWGRILGFHYPSLPAQE